MKVSLTAANNRIRQVANAANDTRMSIGLVCPFDRCVTAEQRAALPFPGADKISWCRLVIIVWCNPVSLYHLVCVFERRIS